jgi:hypothetical protein
VQKGLATSGTSPKHKASIRRNLEELEKIEVDNVMNRVRNFAQNLEKPPAKTTDNVEV